MGFLGLDLPADIRDLVYDITNWNNSGKHITQTLLDAAALLPLIGGLKYTDEVSDVLKVASKQGNTVSDAGKVVKGYTDEIVDIAKPAKRSLDTKIYTAVEYQGTVKINGETYDVSRKVYQRNDIDIKYYDQNTGMTNLERMQAGKPPIGSDGNPIQLHHILQKESGSMVEIQEMTHQQYYSQLHRLIADGSSFRNNTLLNKQYNNFRYNYWKWRAKQMGGEYNNHVK